MGGGETDKQGIFCLTVHNNLKENVFLFLHLVASNISLISLKVRNAPLCFNFACFHFSYVL